MKGNEQSSRESRLGKREKRKKTNIILNSLIALVVLLIIVVSAKIFFGGNNDEELQAEEQTASENEIKENEKNTDKQASDSEQEKEEEIEKAKEDEEKAAEKEEDEEAEDESKEEDEKVVTEGGSSPDVEKTIENPAWKPVGTSQSGEHTAVYDQNAVDWQEMLQAISYATEVDQSNMTVWFLGNNGPNKSVGTISTKDQSEKYRVYIDWVDGQGWKPVKVEVLNEIN
ncbi:YrrS family protein [Bacillus sp. ISL-47]|uniref:YrrS family protein n=1 Tax=Bacillus sp. ISL-47 TaxID=2819130 RepID=UPI001BE5F4E2|nr:YrrS family protein [Bacillus sp. ISL-47]MBT2688010.1 YrrS family protein [Bacillus sp. ISL-47]MBT2707980.1 YrrS family protein [Pseudomonas sp. ISL-84]